MQQSISVLMALCVVHREYLQCNTRASGKGLDELSQPTQTKLYGRSGSTKPNLQSEISWRNGTTCCYGQIPGRLGDLDMQLWQPSEDLLAQCTLPPGECPDDLLPTMSSLLEESDVSGCTAFPVHGALECAESAHISFPGASTAAVHQAKPQKQPVSFSLGPDAPYAPRAPAACHRDCALDWCGLLDDISMPLIPVEEDTPLQGWEVPLAAMSSKELPAHGEPEAVRCSFALTPSSQCSANTSSKPGACLAAEWAHSPVQPPQTPGFFLAPERTCSMGSNDSSVFPTYMPPIAASANTYPSGAPGPCTDAVTITPAASRGACAPCAPASRQPAVRIRAGRRSLYPAPATATAAVSASPSGMCASAGPAAPTVNRGMALRIPSAAAAGLTNAPTCTAPAAPSAADQMAPRYHATGRTGACASAVPAAPTAAPRMAPRIVTRGAAISPRERAPVRPQSVRRAPAARPVTRAPRLAATERNRKIQRAYLQRKQAREQATHACVGQLEERLAELQAHMGPLLAQHEQLTRSLPWHQQQGEVEFMASIASASHCKTEASTMQSLSSPSQFIDNMLVEPDMTVDQIYESAGLHDFKQDYASGPLSGCTAPQDAAGCSLDSTPLQGLVAQLRLNKSQKEAIGEGYARHVQAQAFLQEDCLAIANKLQKLPAPVGALDDSSQHILARHLIGSQLGGIVKRDQELTQRLTQTCCQVLNRHQVDLLCQLAPAGAPLDYPALCQEITGRRPKRARPMPDADSTPTADSKKRVATRASATARKEA